MPRLYDRIQPATEDDLIKVSKENSWSVGDVLSAYTHQIKIARVFEELEDNGDLDRWSEECGYTKNKLVTLLMNCYNDLANLKVYRHLRDTDVRATITIRGKVLHMFLDVLPSDDYRRLESRIRKLEIKLKL